MNRDRQISFSALNLGNESTEVDASIDPPNSIYKISKASSFSDCTEVKPNENCNITISFKPLTAGVHTATLNIKNVLAGTSEPKTFSFTAIDEPKLIIYSFNMISVVKGETYSGNIGLNNIGSRKIIGGVTATPSTAGLTVTPNEACKGDIDIGISFSSCMFAITYDASHTTTYGEKKPAIDITYADKTESVNLTVDVTPGFVVGYPTEFLPKVTQGETSNEIYTIKYTGSDATPDPAPLSIGKPTGGFILGNTTDGTTCGATIAKGSSCDISIKYVAAANARLGVKIGSVIVTLDGYQEPIRLVIEVIAPQPQP